MSVFQQLQLVCQVCGFNMIGYSPENCPFCGASKDVFISAEECSKKYDVVEKEVNQKVSCLNLNPSFGLEHNACELHPP